MAYKYKVYINNEREYFEYSYYEGYDHHKERSEKYDYEFTTTLLDFLYIDIYTYSENTEVVKKALQKGIYPLENVDENIGIIQENINVISGIHPFFKIIKLDMDNRIFEFKAAENGTKNGVSRASLFPYKKISHIPAEVHTMQGQILDLFRNVLDVNSPDAPIQKKMVDYFWKRPLGSTLDKFQFQPLPTNFEMVNDEIFTEVLYPKNIYDIVDFFVRQCVQKEQIFKICKNCGKYFNVTRYQNTEYCNRIFEDGKTCKELGAIKTYQQKINENPVINVYNRAYKTHFARIRIKKMTRDEFSSWSEQARRMRDKCLDGEISLDEFKNLFSKQLNENDSTK